MLTHPRAILREMLTNLTATGGVFNGAKINLYKNDMIPSEATVLASFVPCDFVGYAPSTAVTWATPITNEEGNAEVLGDIKQFTMTTDVTPNTVYGYYVTDTAGTKLLYSERFAQQIPLAYAGQGVAIIPRYEMKQ